MDFTFVVGLDGVVVVAFAFLHLVQDFVRVAEGDAMMWQTLNGV
jgi:hypothetical protein